MLKSSMAYGGMVTAPHHLASQAGVEVLRAGGNAVEAMLAMAATIAVVYPHMNSIGGDGFWLAARPGSDPVSIQAGGPAAKAASPDFFAAEGHEQAIPNRGGLAALTVAGTVGGWIRAAELARQWGGNMPVAELLQDAIRHARAGIAITESQARLTAEKLSELEGVPGFAQTFLVAARSPEKGARLKLPKLAGTLEQLSHAGFADFYRGDVARALASDLESAGSPLRLPDLEAYEAQIVVPLSIRLGLGRVFNLSPPTQGVASLMILGILERLGPPREDSAAFIHDCIEATKQAFLVRDLKIFDPAFMHTTAADLLADAELERMAAAVDRTAALPWPHCGEPGDTIWMGAIDSEGGAVSFIQSLYWEFGSGVVSPATGVLWQNRGVSFSLSEGHPNRLAPGRLPFHTLNPALACFDDGRTMVYGTMGGEGQPQTQAAIFARYAWMGQDLQHAVTAPRWLLGRTWGAASTSVKLEQRFAAETVDQLRRAGHEVELVEAYSDVMGHAGAVVVHRDGLLEGAADPRSDGAVAAL